MMERIVDRSEKKTTDSATLSFALTLFDDGMSLLVVTASFFSSSLFAWARLEEKKKIVHPIVDTRTYRNLCRLACMSLYVAGGHDWSKTQNEHI